MSRVEFGSDFAEVIARSSSEQAQPWDERAVFYGAGRWALRALIEQHLREWKRLWMPSYSCPVLREAVRDIVEVVYYGEGARDVLSGPRGSEVRSGDVVLCQNLFGLGAVPLSIPQGVPVIEDHTHDPWSHLATGSAASWCFASLRKTLPIPDGAVLWSPTGLALPQAPPVVVAHDKLRQDKQRAMHLKRLFLDGALEDKSEYLSLFRSAEGAIANTGVAAMSDEGRSLVATLPSREMRTQRLANWRRFRDQLSGALRKWLMHPADDGAVPFGAILLLPRTDIALTLRAALVARSVFPAQLWPMQGMEDVGVHRDAIDESERLLMLHLDSRYDTAGVDQLARTVNELAAEFL